LVTSQFVSVVSPYTTIKATNIFHLETTLSVFKLCLPASYNNLEIDELIFTKAYHHSLKPCQHKKFEMPKTSFKMIYRHVNYTVNDTKCLTRTMLTHDRSSSVTRHLLLLHDDCATFVSAAPPPLLPPLALTVAHQPPVVPSLHRRPPATPTTLLLHRRPHPSSFYNRIWLPPPSTTPPRNFGGATTTSNANPAPQHLVHCMRIVFRALLEGRLARMRSLGMRTACDV
jgi:hypothetical protein